MAKATSCNFEGRRISVDAAIEQRDAAHGKRRRYLEFQCIECAQRVRPHKESKCGIAHFEHFDANPDCRLSAPPR
jgi:hypothetical protein